MEKIDQKGLNDSLKTQEELIENSEILKKPEETVFASAVRAKNLAASIRAHLSGKKVAGVYASKIVKVASEIQEGVETLGLSPIIIEIIPDLVISEDPEDTAVSFEEYAKGCEEAGNKICEIKQDAANQIVSLSNAVMAAEKPSFKKVQAHTQTILKAMGDAIWNGGIYNPAEEKRELIRDSQFTTRPNIQNRKLNSVIDWDTLKIINPKLYSFRSVLSRLSYSDIRDLYSAVRGTNYDKEMKKEIQKVEEGEASVGL